MNIICPMNNIGIKHPVICSDRYVYEEKCIKQWLKNNVTSPVTREIIEYVKPWDGIEKCLNIYGDEIEDYEKSIFVFSWQEDVVGFYDKLMRIYGSDLEDFIIDNKDIMLELVKINRFALKYASDELKNDKGIAIEAIYNHPHAFGYISEGLQNDKEIVIEALKIEGLIIFDLSEELLRDEEIINIGTESLKKRFKIL